MKRVQTGDRNLQAVQDNIAAALEAASPMAGGIVLGGSGKPVSLASGVNSIGHGLGHVPQYWTLLDNTAGVTVYRTAWDAKTITLQASGATTVILWVA